MLGLELDRRDVVESAVKSVVVERVDPGQGGVFEVAGGAPGAVGPDAFELVEPDQRLGLGVVVRVADAADGGEGAGLLEPAGVAEREVLRPRL